MYCDHLDSRMSWFWLFFWKFGEGRWKKLPNSVKITGRENFRSLAQFYLPPPFSNYQSLKFSKKLKKKFKFFLHFLCNWSYWGSKKGRKKYRFFSIFKGSKNWFKGIFSILFCITSRQNFTLLSWRNVFWVCSKIYSMKFVEFLNIYFFIIFVKKFGCFFGFIF